MNPTPRKKSQDVVLVDAELASPARLSPPDTGALKRIAGPFPLWGWFLVAALGVFVNSRGREGSYPRPATDPDVSSLPPSGAPPDLSSFEARPSGGTTSDGTDATTDDIRAALDLQCALLRTLLESERDIARLVSAQIGTHTSSSTGARSIAPRSKPATVKPPERSSVPIVVPAQAPEVPAQAPEAVEAPKTQPAPERRKRKRRRAPLFLLAAASLALNGVFIWHSRSHVPRPSLVAVRPTTGSPALQAKHGARAGQKSPGAVVRSGAGDVVSAPSGQTVRQQNPKHQSHAGRPSGRHPVQPSQSAKRASERPVSPVHAVAGRAGQQLRWNAVAGATYYNLVLWRDGKRVLDLWPTSPQAVLPSAWSYHGIQHRLVPGRYLWFVYPGIGAKASQQYGALAGSGVVVVR